MANFFYISRVLASSIVALSTIGMVTDAEAASVVKQYGDADRLGVGGTYDFSTATAGAILIGLPTDGISLANSSFGHGFPFSPDAGEMNGTDQIYTASGQSAFNDGYSMFSGRIQGALQTVLDYSDVVPTGEVVTSLTLGIAADDFQQPALGQPYQASINGQVNNALTARLNSLLQTGPAVQFFSIGLNPNQLSANNMLDLVIENTGNGQDGWAVDFFTVGVETEVAQASVPTPALLPGLIGFGASILRKKRKR